MAYSLVNSYAGDALISGFNWIDTPDYSNGFVRYQSQANAASHGLFAVDEQTGVVRIGVDHTNTYDVSSGRPSIRIESKDAYNHGLFIGDFLHMPPSQCGVWPAFWAYGTNWPAGGEIDIIEGANTAHRNIISAHTTPGCQLGPDVLSMASGAAQSTNCDVGTQNIGCGYVPAAGDTSSYGDTFNAVGGGIYAMQWDDEYIKVWHFDRASAPADIAAKKPKPDTWGKPQAVYGGKSCDVKSHFRDMSIVLNINFCGDYGNAVWANDGCTALAPTCSEWVAKNPAAFANAYWDVNYIDAYVQGAASPSGSSVPSGIFPSASGIANPNQPSNIQTASFTRLPGTAPSNNGTFTRFPVANNSSASMPNPTNPSSSESTTWTTKTSTDTRTVTVPSGPIPTATLPSPSGKPHANPANLDGFSYLGCFGSSSGFKSFDKVADSADMDLDKCIDLCRGKKYAGVFDTTCYCAAELDADTRVSMDTCDTACPGDSSQFCGGRVKSNGKFIGATANITLPRTSSAVSGGVPMPIATEGEYMPGGGAVNGTSGNSTRPEQPAPSGSGSPIAKGNSTAAPETPKVANTGAKFNSTGPEILPAFSSSPASSPSASGGTRSSSSIAPPTTAINPVVKFNSTGPEIPAPAPGSSKTTSSDIPEVTIPVYPVEAKVKNATAPESTQQTSGSPSLGSSSPSSSSAAPASSAPAPALFRNSTFVGRGVHGARWAMLKNARRGMPVRREAADFLLTVYAAVAKEEPPKQPPGMGLQTPHSSATIMRTLDASVGAGGSISTASSGSGNGNAATSTTSTVVTTITYQTVHPSNPSKIITEKYVTTIVKAHCGCTETPLPVMTVPMETKVVSCSACGHKGANTVTVTVPCSVSIATPAASNVPPASHGIAPPASHSNALPSSNGNANPSSNGQVLPSSNGNKPAPSSGNVPPAANSNAPTASNGNTPPASSGNVPTVAPSTVPTVAGASGLKVTSLLFSTMLAMALLL
ncbi:GPI anchored endo-1,3(4)-beta-glucanase [Akanthomyces lecanii RCEF 1005]|uniref:GPI anchored endo-1,3(4)-beta-glucanase n=1 Tax=Akanthomyces lecanii RCEF 1005 TaxID=1081108 RepID=A0A162KD08_CORDF|nr:GPI anchored endo-1,3(4)-beta-glucanase [Akanthomyces lecanii RCEF 1005]